MSFTITKKINFARPQHAKRDATAPAADSSVSSGRVPRVARLMSLAIYYEHLMRCGAVTTQAEIAMLSHVTRARITQIMNLLHLAPDIQEAILFLPSVVHRRDRLHEHDLRPLAAEVQWDIQRALWQRLTTTTCE